MNADDLKFVDRVETLAKHAFLELSIADVVLVCRMVREQNERARHAEAERAKSWDEFEKETLTALGSDVIGTIVDAGSDIPGMIRRLHERYHAEIRQEQLRRTEAEKQRDTYKRIANMKQRKDKP